MLAWLGCRWPDAGESTTTGYRASDIRRPFLTALSHSRGGNGARFLPKADVRRQVAHHTGEVRKGERLGAVADRFFGARVNFDDQPVGADCHASAGKRRHQASFAGG